MRPTLILVALPLVACKSMGYAYSGMGVNPGGSEDIQLARDLIANGYVPDQTQFTAEGLFSEHDLPLSGEECTETVCPRAKSTIHRPLDGADPQLLVQLGFGSNIDVATFERDEIDIAAVVDISGSMEGEKIALAKDAVHRLIDQLGPYDHLSLVRYGDSAKLSMERLAMHSENRAAAHDAVDDLEIDGSTDMESGMRLGYEQLVPSESGMHRLMVFSDALPNTGITAESAFLEMVRDESAVGNHTTIFGVGTDLGAELANVMAKVRGGSLHFVSENNVEQLFSDEFDFQVTPVGFDLEAHMIPRDGLAIETVYGAPIDGGGVTLGASTLFLSHKRGGIAALFDGAPEAAMDVGTMSVSFDPADGSARISQGIDVTWDGGTFAGDADDLGVYKIDGLVDEYLALLAAADFCDGGADPLPTLEATASRLDALAGELEDAQLAVEAELVVKLSSNVQSGGCL